MHSSMNKPTVEGAHLLFGLLLITADLQVILQHSAQRESEREKKKEKKKETGVIAGVTSCLLVLGLIRPVVIANSL